MARTVLKLEGLRELEVGLADLKKTAAKAVARRALMNAGRPLADAMSENAPENTGFLAEHIGEGTKLSRRQARLNRKQSDVEVYVGAPATARATQQEFGNRFQPPQPYARPAWDAEKHNVMFDIRDELGRELEKNRQRAARRQARLIAKAQASK